MANAQKCGGVHKKRTTDRMSGAGENVFPVAAEPTRTAKLPASPPITIFIHVHRFNQTVYTMP